jgi:hypothetical protein
MKMNKVVTFTSPPMPKDLLDKLISAVIQKEGDEMKEYLEQVMQEVGKIKKPT